MGGSEERERKERLGSRKRREMVGRELGEWKGGVGDSRGRDAERERKRRESVVGVGCRKRVLFSSFLQDSLFIAVY